MKKAGTTTGADALYAECCQQSPDDYDFAVNRACCARQRGAEDAEALFEEAATLSERPYACSFNLAELAARGDIQTALARAKEAVAHADGGRGRRRGTAGAPRCARDSLDDANVAEYALAHGLRRDKFVCSCFGL